MDVQPSALGIPMHVIFCSSSSDVLQAAMWCVGTVLLGCSS